jgi:hypothetical protein
LLDSPAGDTPSRTAALKASSDAPPTATSSGALPALTTVTALGMPASEGVARPRLAPSAVRLLHAPGEPRETGDRQGLPAGKSQQRLIRRATGSPHTRVKLQGRPADTDTALSEEAV